MEEAQEYQKKSLVTGKETDPKEVAKLVAFLANNDTKYMSGCIIEAGY